jgi:hypothetical protein
MLLAPFLLQAHNDQILLERTAHLRNDYKTLLNETARQAYMLLAPFFLPAHDDQARQAYMLLVPFHQLLSHDENARQAYKLLVPCTKLQLNATAKSFLLYLHYEPESLPLLECSADTLFHSLPSPKWF